MLVSHAKVTVLFVLLLLKLMCGLCPVLLSKTLMRRRIGKCNERLIGIVLCFGGGVLLATVNIHMIPEV